MKNNERLRKNLKSDKDQRPHKAQHGSEPIVNKSLTREGDQSPILETPFYSRMDEHAATLSRIPFTAQRQEYIMRLNNAYGLRYVQRLLESVNAQAKLTVSDPGDIYEQEADKVADEVTREINAQVQRQNQEEEEEELIQPMQDLQRQDEDITRGNQRQNMATCEACGKEYDMDETGETCPYCGATEPLVSLEYAISQSQNAAEPNMATCEACGKEYDMNETGETCPYCGATEPLVSLEYAISQSQNAAEPNMATCEACGKEYDMNETGETCPYCGAAEPLVSLRNKSIPSEGRVFEEESLHGKLGQRQEEEEEELVMMKRDEKTEADVTDEIEMRINSAKGSGQPLASEVKKPMEQAFGADFNDVKVHTNTEADTLNKQLNAKAFTTGTDIFFRDGEYSPGSDGGNKLIAHELTHVVQQTGRKHGEESSTKRNGRR